MTFDEWTKLMTERLKRHFPTMSVLARDPGICYVVGISALDMVELYGDQVLLIPHKDPLALVDGKLFSRHKGMTLDRVQFDMNDEQFVQALFFIRSHFGHADTHDLDDM